MINFALFPGVTNKFAGCQLLTMRQAAHAPIAGIACVFVRPLMNPTPDSSCYRKSSRNSAAQSHLRCSPLLRRTLSPCLTCFRSCWWEKLKVAVEDDFIVRIILSDTFLLTLTPSRHRGHFHHIIFITCHDFMHVMIIAGSSHAIHSYPFAC